MGQSVAKSWNERVELPSRRGEPAWEIARLYPMQGHWTEEQYLALDTNQRIEFANGVLEFYSMPSWIHEWILEFVHDRLKEFVRPRKLGVTAGSGARVRLADGSVRLPDVKFLRRDRIQNLLKPSDGADVVFEIVSPDPGDRERDLEEKRVDYARSGIPEYWIIDPETETITVLTLSGDEYQVHGEFKPGQTATSVFLEGFEIDVTACFAAGQGEY